MLVFDRVCMSDHRALYMDIDLKAYIDTNIAINESIPRGIRSTHPKIVQKYKISYMMNLEIVK